MDGCTDQDQDVIDILSAVIREAHQQACMVGRFLKAVGFLSPEFKRTGKTRSLPCDFLLKLGALTKLYQLDQADLKNHLPEELPNWQDLYEDVCNEANGEESRFCSRQLGIQLLKVHLERLCWLPFANSTSAVAVSQTIDQDTFLDQLAELLWDSRHLGREQIQGTEDEQENQE